nr:MAG TPA: hypothetical protein [Caudoviricetes sp.]
MKPALRALSPSLKMAKMVSTIFLPTIKIKSFAIKCR